MKRAAIACSLLLAIASAPLANTVPRRAASSPRRALQSGNGSFSYYMLQLRWAPEALW
jgi:ribonuclease I